jgi:hypothetical protein
VIHVRIASAVERDWLPRDGFNTSSSTSTSTSRLAGWARSGEVEFAMPI